MVQPFRNRSNAATTTTTHPNTIALPNNEQQQPTQKYQDTIDYNRRMPILRLVTYTLLSCFACTFLSCAWRLVIHFMIQLKMYRMDDDDHDDNASSWTLVRFLWKELVVTMSVLAGWLLGLMPMKVSSGNAPGFVFASSWLFLPIRDRFRSIPNIPTRINEMVLGRITPRELMIMLPAHFIGACLGAFVYRMVLPISLSNLAIEPIVYSEGNPWIVDFVREVIINAIFTVSILVIPELLKVNNLPPSLCIIFLFPIYSYGVDSSGNASTFGPDVIYAMRCVSRNEEVPLGQSSHMIGPIVGGLVGGKIMCLLFPDG